MSAQTIAKWTLVVGIAITALYWYPKSWVAYGFINIYYAGLSSGLIAIALTVLLIDNANEQRDRRQLKKRLTWEMGSSDQGFAVRAAKELRDVGWLIDGSLEGVDLTVANLSRAQLSNARLKNAVLSGATLNKTNFEEADLRAANLEEAAAQEVNFRKAQLGGANLRYAKLPEGNLEEIQGYHNGQGVDMLGASLIQASLRRAKLREARLEGCDFIEADFTILKDVDLDGADLAELQDWQQIANIQGAKIGGVKNPPEGFREWAVSQGAIESTVAGTLH
jgi:hypothetical protein